MSAGATGIAAAFVHSWFVKPPERSALFRLARATLLAILVVVLFLLLQQHRLIYYPRKYGETFASGLAGRATELRYTTRDGAQCAFYVPPSIGTPERIWVMFGGNGSLALHWLDLIESNPGRARDGFLLIDYPGYGLCEGNASPRGIQESAQAAAGELGRKLGLSPTELEQKWNVVGHSIGCATALNFAAKHQVQRIILIAPFTTMRDMAKRVVGWPLCYVLLHNFDNRARLRELAKREPRPKVTAFHGSADDLIPTSMSRTLQREFPGFFELHEIDGADHNDVLAVAENQILRAMSDDLPRTNSATARPR